MHGGRRDRKAVAIMALGALVGTPLGTYALTRLDPLTTRWIISAFVLAPFDTSGFGFGAIAAKTMCRSRWASAAFSGFCSGLAQTGGPPIVAYWLGRPHNLRHCGAANILFVFSPPRIFFSAASYSLAGLITPGAVKFSLVVGPAYAIGVLLGATLFGKSQRSAVPLDLLRADRRSRP